MRAIYPNLEVLDLLATESLPRAWQLQPEDLASLPHSLKGFHAPQTELIGMRSLSTLPCGLEALTVDWRHLSFENVVNLPKSLKSIQGILHNLEEEFYSVLPRSLTRLDANIEIFDASTAASLPPSLTAAINISHVEISDFTRLGLHWARSLPSKLTILRVPFRYLDSASIGLLPRSLTSLLDKNIERLMSLEDIPSPPLNHLRRMASQPSWPEQLQSLSWSIVEDQYTFSSLLDIPKLPASLTSLAIPVYYSREDSVPELSLPTQLPSLTDLRLLPPCDITQYRPHFSLSICEVNILSGFDKLITLDISQEIDFDAAQLFALPRNLVELKITIVAKEPANQIQASEVASLPPALRRLTIWGEFPASTLGHLPRQLESISFGSIHGIKSDKELTELPTSLSSLEIRLDKPPASEAPVFFKSLHPGIQRLVIHHKISTEILKSLSPRIVQLEFTLDTTPKFFCFARPTKVTPSLALLVDRAPASSEGQAH